FVTNIEEAIGGNTVISIANRGTAPAEYLSVKARAGNLEKEYYIGSLDSGDYETINFPKSGIGKYDLNLTLQYRDKFNNDYIEEKMIVVSPTIGMSPTLVIVLLAVFVGVFWYYNKYKKK
ncbi:MAG: hypothetical protein PHU12_02190, partial [Candidatus Aenigmarchaeota archaeon]|nr:hypothetical protein [Candidatus Aenigmarchaeota archaeon]